MKDKKFIQIIIQKNIWEMWMEVAEKNGMPLVTFIKHLMNIEVNKFR